MPWDSSLKFHNPSMTSAEKGYGPEYLGALMTYVASEPAAQNALLFVIGKTLGRALDSVNLASPLLLVAEHASGRFMKTQPVWGFRRAPRLGDDPVIELFWILPEGMWVGKM